MSRGWVLVTRSERELADFREPLAAAGLTVVPYPVLCESAVFDAAGWAATLAALPRLRAVAFTSPRAPAALRAAAQTQRIESDIVALPAFAVGAATARAAAAAALAAEAARAGGGGQQPPQT